MQSVGGWTLVQEAGRGAVAAIWKAERDGRVAAVKVLLERWTDDASVRARFEREGVLLGRLSHPHVVRILETGREGARPYHVLEFVEGPTLARALEKRAFTRRQLALLLAAVARGAQHAHDHGVVHGDIVPGNILLKGDGTPRLADFGIARPAGEADPPGVTAGTPVYMSPEQAAPNGRGIDARSDVYSLGAVLYEAVAGRPPYTGRSTREVLDKVVRGAPRPPRELGEDVDPALEAIVLRALEKEPERRYPSAAALAEALEAWAASATDVWFSMLAP